ncbi:hypothetical protein [Brevibacillus formosus]|uniref:hypothetical protein n=1 Tax=Brevibacillus formosus TaxID=54913 RepID=UPI003F1E08B3
MKHEDSYKQLEKLFHSTVIPKIDVNKKVMSAIYKDKNEMEAAKVKKKIGLLVIVGLLVGASTAIGAMQVIQLKNEKGEVVYEVKMQNKENPLPQLSQEEQEQGQWEDEEDERVLKIVNEIKNGLQPGKAAAVYVVPKLPKQENIQYPPGVLPDIYFVSKEFEFTKMADLQAKLDGTIPLPSELPGTYAFSKSYVMYKANNDFDDSSMREEAKKFSKEYVVREIELSNTLEQMHVYYQGSKGKITLKIQNDNETVGTHTEGSRHDLAEKITVGGNETIYREFHSNRDNTKMMSWMKNGTRLHYNVISESKEMTKEELVKIVESIITAK